jgi:hypothetical protein
VYTLATKSFDDLEIVLPRPQSGLDDNFSLGSSKYDFASLVYKNIFKNTYIKTSNPFREDSEGETALIANPSGDVEKGILKILLERYPEAEELITARDNEAKVEYVVRTTETITSRGGKQNRRKYDTYYRTMRRRNRIWTRRSFKN